MAVWAAGGGSGSFSSSGGLSTLAVTGCIEGNQPDSLGTAAGQDGAGTGVDSSCDVLQPRGVELPQEQAAACSATSAATASSTAAGSAVGGGSSGGSSSKSRFWWSALSGASAGVAAAATSAPNSSDKPSVSAAPGAAAAGGDAAAGGCDASVASASTPLPALQLPTSPSSGYQDPQDSTGQQTAPAAAAAGSSAPGSSKQPGLATSYSGPCRTLSKGASPLTPREAASTGGTSSAGAATASQAGAPGRERATGGSWPGGVTATSQQQQQAAGQRVNCLAVAHMRLSHSRSTSQDGAGGGTSSAPVLRSSGSRLLTPRTLQPVLQGQPSVGGGLLPAAPLLAPAVAPSPFVMRGVVRVPFRVECHRLGLYHFKGGPPQQEMVQVRPATRSAAYAGLAGWLAGTAWSRQQPLLTVVDFIRFVILLLLICTATVTCVRVVTCYTPFVDTCTACEAPARPCVSCHTADATAAPLPLLVAVLSGPRSCPATWWGGCSSTQLTARLPPHARVSCCSAWRGA